jgi:hypothetical protein
MQSTKWRVRASRFVFTLVVLLPVSTAVGTVPSTVAAGATSSGLPACRASQLTVTGGATLTNTTYPVMTTTGVHQASAYEVVPVYFYNRGENCHGVAPDGAVEFNSLACCSAAVSDFERAARFLGAVDSPEPITPEHGFFFSDSESKTRNDVSTRWRAAG